MIARPARRAVPIREGVDAAIDRRLFPCRASEPQAGERHGANSLAMLSRVVGTCVLVVMASHGRKGLKRLLLGSETQHVLTHCHVPVLVLR